MYVCLGIGCPCLVCAGSGTGLEQPVQLIKTALLGLRSFPHLQFLLFYSFKQLKQHDPLSLLLLTLGCAFMLLSSTISLSCHCCSLRLSLCRAIGLVCTPKTAHAYIDEPPLDSPVLLSRMMRRRLPLFWIKSIMADTHNSRSPPFSSQTLPLVADTTAGSAGGAHK